MPLCARRVRTVSTLRFSRRASRCIGHGAQQLLLRRGPEPAVVGVIVRNRQSSPTLLYYLQGTAQPLGQITILHGAQQLVFRGRPGLVARPRQEHVQLMPALDDSAQWMTGAGGDFRIRHGPQQLFLFGRPPVERRLISQDSQLLARAPNRLLCPVEPLGPLRCRAWCPAASALPDATERRPAWVRRRLPPGPLPDLVPFACISIDKLYGGVNPTGGREGRGGASER